MFRVELFRPWDNSVWEQNKKIYWKINYNVLKEKFGNKTFSKTLETIAKNYDIDIIENESVKPEFIYHSNGVGERIVIAGEKFNVLILLNMIANKIEKDEEIDEYDIKYIENVLGLETENIMYRESSDSRLIIISENDIEHLKNILELCD